MAALELAAAVGMPAGLPALQEAIRQARAVGIFSYKVKKFVELCERENERETRKVQARGGLHEALARYARGPTRADALLVGVDRAREGLVEALENARAAGLTEDEMCEACEVVQRSAAQHSARMRFREALRWREMAVLEDAVRQGEEASLDAEELAAMRRHFNEECLRELRQAMEASNLHRLEAAIQQGQDVLLEKELSEAREKAAELRLPPPVEVCDICFDEGVETNTMPCCGQGREGGGRICSACLGQIITRQGKCPFCREDTQ